MPAAERAKQGPALAAQLEDLLDDTPFDITTFSRDPEGDTADGLPASREHLDTFEVDGQKLELQLERVELRPGYHVWMVASDSLPLIPKAHQLVEETPFEKKLPQVLVTLEILDTPLWRWIALILMALVISALARALALGLVAAVRPRRGCACAQRSAARVAGVGGISGRAGTRAARHVVTGIHRALAGDAGRPGNRVDGTVAGRSVCRALARPSRSARPRRELIPCFRSAGRSSSFRSICLPFSASSVRGATIPPP